MCSRSASVSLPFARQRARQRGGRVRERGKKWRERGIKRKEDLSSYSLDFFFLSQISSYFVFSPSPRGSLSLALAIRGSRSVDPHSSPPPFYLAFFGITGFPRQSCSRAFRPGRGAGGAFGRREGRDRISPRLSGGSGSAGR